VSDIDKKDKDMSNNDINSDTNQQFRSPDC